MNMQRINNFRMAGYLLLAVGLINLRYQTGKSSVLTHSLILIAPGALLLASTFTDAGKEVATYKSRHSNCDYMWRPSVGL
jgi:hypothetical protein